MSLLLANGFKRVFEIFDGCSHHAVVPTGVIDFGGYRISTFDMRFVLLEYLRNNNVLIGFHVAETRRSC